MSHKEQYWRLLLSIGLLAGSKITGILSPYYFKQAVDSINVAAAGQSQCVMLVVYMGACRIASAIFKELLSPVLVPALQASSRQIAYNTFSHVLHLDMAFHLSRDTGKLMSILNRGTRSFQILFRGLVFTFIPTFLELTVVCVILYKSFKPSLTIVVLSTFAAYVLWTIIMTAPNTKARKIVNDVENRAGGKATDALLNYETVSNFNNQSLEMTLYADLLLQQQRAEVLSDLLSAAMNGGQAIVLWTGMTLSLVMAVGAGATSGDLVLINGILLQLWAPLQFLGWFYREFRKSLVDLGEFVALLSTKSSIQDGHVTLHSPRQPLLQQYSTTNDNDTEKVQSDQSQQERNGSSDSSNELVQGKGPQTFLFNDDGECIVDGEFSTELCGSDIDNSISLGTSDTNSNNNGVTLQLKDVVFNYPGRKGKPLVRGINMTIKSGESVAIVGPSGSGKSTLLRLITRMYDTLEGQVLVDGRDIRDYTIKSLRGAIAVVPQDTVLFNLTIEENIAYGYYPGATEEEVDYVAHMAQLSNSIDNFPDGLKSIVGERGLKLSGGERQRIAIARAFIKQPRLLICDEATSALDTNTEQQILQSLNTLAQNKTSVFVAHRLSTVRDCDCIYVMNNGKLVESGKHEYLLGLRGVYWSMWTQQASGSENECDQLASSESESDSEIDNQSNSSNTLLTQSP